MDVLETTSLNVSTIGEWPFVDVGVETMQPASRRTEPLRLFSGKPTPRLYGRIIEVLNQGGKGVRSPADLL